MGKRGFPWSWGCNSSPLYKDVTTINYLGVFSDKIGDTDCQFKLYCDGYKRSFYGYIYYRQFILRIFHRTSTVEDIDNDKWQEVDWKNETYDEYTSSNQDIKQRPCLYYDRHDKRNDTMHERFLRHNDRDTVNYHIRWTKQFPSFVNYVNKIQMRHVHIPEHNAFYYITRSFKEGLRIERIQYEGNNRKTYFILAWDPYYFGYTRNGVTYNFESVLTPDMINELMEMLKSIVYQQRIEFFDCNHESFKKDMKAILGKSPCETP